jgi:hypothetical protein
MVYLDVEKDIYLAPNYWDGWSQAVRTFVYYDVNLAQNVQPFFPGCYVNLSPYNTQNPCATLAANARTSGIWDVYPQATGAGSCDFPWDPFGATSCSVSGPGYTTARAWQFKLGSGCNWGDQHLDLNRLTDAWNELQNMIHFHY